MPEFIFLMHDDARDDLPDAGADDSWAAYLQRLKASGSFDGGSAIGDGICVRTRGPVPGITAHLAGYIRVTADDLDHARALLAGNPHLESGGTVEIRVLPRTG